MEILEDTEIYAKFSSRESLAQAMIHILSDEERLARLKKGVRERAVEELSWRKAGERFQ